MAASLKMRICSGGAGGFACVCGAYMLTDSPRHASSALRKVSAAVARRFSMVLLTIAASALLSGALVRLAPVSEQTNAKWIFI